jgi:FkbM family methyltransferase
MKSFLYDGNIIYHYGKTDYISKVIMKHKNWEPKITCLINLILKNKNDNIFFDIGCNIGYYSIIASKFCKKIYSFDANNQNLNLLNKSMNENNIKNILYYNNAISNKSDEYFDIKPDDKVNNRNIGGIKYIKSSDLNVTNQMVRSISLDEFIISNNIEEIDLIKIDIEGGELNCLLGSENTLSKNIIKKIILELSPKFNDDSKDILNLLQVNDYLIYDIGLQEGGKLINDDSLYSKITNTLITDFDYFIKNIELQTNILAVKKS